MNELSVNQPTFKLYIEGIQCSACMWKLEQLPESLPNEVASCSLNFGTSVLTVHPRENQSAPVLSKVLDQIKAWGYTPHPILENQQATNAIEAENKKRLIDVGIAGALAGNIMLMTIPLYTGVEGSFLAFFEWTSFGLAVPSLFYCGRSFFSQVWAGLKALTFPIDLPILLALLVAFFYSTSSLIQSSHLLYFDSLSALVFLLLASRYYLSRLRLKTRINLGTLSSFDTQSNHKIGDCVSLQAGEPIRFDGKLKSGLAWIDGSRFSGEANSVEIKVGDLVYAGTRLLDAQPNSEFEVEKTGPDTRLAKLLDKIADAQHVRTRTETTSDRLAQKLLAAVTTVGIVALIYFANRGMLVEGINRVLALLIVTCPCALALATPLVFSLGTQTLLKKGLLVKDPHALDDASQIQSVYFDKTGTLTEGRIQLVEFPNSLSSDDLSALYSIVRRSHHPISRAIERAFPKGTIEKTLRGFTETPGLGCHAKVITTGKSYRLERPVLNFSGNTEVAFYEADRELVRLRFEDSIRPEAKSVIADLHEWGFETAILSGDHRSPCEKIANEVGIKQVYSLQTPEQKASRVQNQMMIGDGLNDALALSTAKVSIAVQGGMDAAVASSQVFSLRDGLMLIPAFFETSRRVRNTLRLNFVFSTSYNAVSGTLALLGFMNPLIAAILMPLSALTVFTYSMFRFREVRPE